MSKHNKDIAKNSFSVVVQTVQWAMFDALYFPLHGFRCRFNQIVFIQKTTTKFIIIVIN